MAMNYLSSSTRFASPPCTAVQRLLKVAKGKTTFPKIPEKKPVVVKHGGGRGKQNTLERDGKAKGLVSERALASRDESWVHHEGANGTFRRREGRRVQPKGR